MLMGENQSLEKLRRHVRWHSAQDMSASNSSSSSSRASMRGRTRGSRARSLAVIAAVLMGSAAANLQTAERNEAEITALNSIGLSSNEAPSPASAPAATQEESQSSAASEAPASSSFSSSGSDEIDIVARMPIDVHDLALDESSGTDWSSSSSGEQSGSREQSATATIVFLEPLPTSQSGSSDDSGSASEAGENEVVFITSSSSDSGSGSGRAQDDVGYIGSNSSSSSSGQGDSDVGFEDHNATSVLLFSSSDSGSGSSSGIEIDTVEFAAVLTSSYAADKQDADKAYSLTIEPVATTTHFASAVAAAAGSDSDSTSSDSVASSKDEPETDAPSSQMHGVPSNPTLVSAVAHDGRAEVTWKTPDDDGSDSITEYEVSWFDEEDNALVGTQIVAQIEASLTAAKNTSSSTSTTNSSTSTTSTSTTATTSATTTTAKNADNLPTSTVVSHLLNGKSYTFKVRAKNVNGFSVWSAKSLAVSPLHPPDLCGRISCSGRGTCFPNYHQERTTASTSRKVKRSMKSVDSADDAASSLDAQCFCRPGFRPPDCSVKDDKTQFVWKVSEWSSCSSGCGGGKRSREATCWDLATDKAATTGDAGKCADVKKPSLTGICNGMECGSKLVSVKYEVEMSYDEVLFSPEAIEAFELAFTTEVSAALQIPRTRLEVTALKRGSIAVFFQILPASRVGEKSLNDIVEQLQDELDNATSTLRSKGTFARRVEPNGVKLSFSLADQSVQGGAEDISILGLIGTVLVLCVFVFAFGWSLRRRHQRNHKQEEDRDHPERVLEATKSDMKRMGIRTMA
ncbi:hypothetical protein Gpo141_00001679 [Globisporangium polare]